MSKPRQPLLSSWESDMLTIVEKEALCPGECCRPSDQQARLWSRSSGLLQSTISLGRPGCCAFVRVIRLDHNPSFAVSQCSSTKTQLSVCFASGMRPCLTARAFADSFARGVRDKVYLVYTIRKHRSTEISQDRSLSDHYHRYYEAPLQPVAGHLSSQRPRPRFGSSLILPKTARTWTPTNQVTS